MQVGETAEDIDADASLMRDLPRKKSSINLNAWV